MKVELITEGGEVLLLVAPAEVCQECRELVGFSVIQTFWNLSWARESRRIEIGGGIDRTAQ